MREFSIESVEYQEALRLREDVLRKPIGLTLTEDDVVADQRGIHLGAFSGGRLIGVLQLVPTAANSALMRQVAVHPDFQKQGVGAALILCAEETARARGIEKITAHARASALKFYQRCGYHPMGSEFTQTTLPHWHVEKAIKP